MIIEILETINLRIGHLSYIKEVEIFQFYSLFSTKFPLYVRIPLLWLSTETLSKETQRENSVLKRPTEENPYLSSSSAIASSPHLLYLEHIRKGLASMSEWNDYSKQICFSVHGM